MSEAHVMLITGTRKGIGRHLAEKYAKLGWRVVGCSRKEPDFTLQNYEHGCLDVADEIAAVKFFRHIRKTYGRLDALINNAGAAATNSALLTPARQIESILATNVTGTFLFCREATKLMRLRKWGRIVNFTTVAVPLRLEGEAAYVASKAAVLSLTQVLARELAPFGVTVNAIGPAPVETDLIRSVPKPKIDALIERQAVKRMGTFIDIANVVDFFLRPESDFVTGQVIFLGGVN
jgi:3-oxoacyl-[acyl-carrier protein] reductase